MKRKPLIVLWVLALIAGVSIMLYPLVSSLVNAQSASRVIDAYDEAAASLDDDEALTMREAAERYNEGLSSSTVVMTDPFDEDAVRFASEGYEDVLDIDGEGMMAYLDIPSIDVHLPIYHGTSSEVLRRAVGHLEGTSVPIGGEGAHSVLSAHSGLSSARLFTDLDELTEGDTFSITVLGEVLTYEVYAIETVEPDDTSSLSIQEGEDLCTLVTCTPLGINTHRLLVHGTRIPTPASTEEVGAQAPAFSWWHLVVGGVVVLVALVVLARLVRRSRRRRKRIRALWREVHNSP